ncbi:MAG: prepilin peptidase [Candidatus Eremiobacteraeota bacterium]|nr:prepilin peptidase [Candidatus Eremiobacteraeota bacterium]
MTVLVALVYGCAAYLVVQLSAFVCKDIAAFDDGPRPGRPPSVALVAGAAVCGAALAYRGAGYPALALAALLVLSLVACWYSDVRCGILPDIFTLVPLGIVLAIALWSRNPAPFFAAAVVVIPIGGTALLSKGRGMGWGDVKLMALGAAVLPLGSVLLAFSAACIVAVVAAALRRRRYEPIAFAPYLSGALALVLAFAVPVVSL